MSGCASAGELTLIAPSQEAPVIVLPEDPHPDEHLAARELQDHLLRMTGQTVAVARPGKKNIWLGRAARIEAPRSGDPAAFTWRVGLDGVAVRGNSPEGTLFGVYALLESLGVRWFMPGEMGTVIPQRELVTLPLGTHSESPSFRARHLQGGKGVEGWDVWYRRMRLGGPYFPAAHGLRIDLPFEKHPEAWALIRGRRMRTQHCVSNPLVLQELTRVVNDYFRKHPEAEWIGLGPNDGGGYCWCDACRALDGGDFDPKLDSESMTDRYVWLFNRVLEGLEPRFRNRSIAFYAYLGTRRPPVRHRPDPRLVPALAPIMLCRIHGPGNPVCPDGQRYAELLQGWKALVPRVYDRGYWTNLNDPGLPFPMMHRLRSQLPLAHRLGLEGWRVECFHNWAAEMPSLYVACKLMWDHEADVDQLVADFARNYYGPAAEPMEAYHRLLDRALRDGDFHRGGAWDLPRLYPPEVRSQAATLLEQAGDTPRVEATRLAFLGLQGFAAMMEARDRADFEGAQEGLNQVLAMQARLAREGMINQRLASRYLRDTYAPAVVDGQRLLTPPNRILATGEGVVELGTLPSRVFVWVGGVDDQAEVWLNGAKLGESSVPAFAPFEFEATGVARRGANRLELVVRDRVVNEVGTGGMVGPVVIYGR